MTNTRRSDTRLYLVSFSPHIRGIERDICLVDKHQDQLSLDLLVWPTMSQQTLDIYVYLPITYSKMLAARLQFYDYVNIQKQAP